MAPVVLVAIGWAFAGARGDAKRLLAAEQWEEASGVCRAELAIHPGRGWAERCALEASDARVDDLLERAGQAADREDLDGALRQMETARRVVKQAVVSGVPVAEPALTERSLRARAAASSLLAAAKAVQDERWLDGVSGFRSALELLDPADHPPVEADLTAAMRRAAEEVVGADRAELYETLASRTGSADDRAAAAEAWRSHAVAAEARGAVREAVEALARAVVHDPSLGEELTRVERLARTDILLRVSGADREVADALREGLESALRSRGSRFVHVLARGGSARQVPGDDAAAEVGPARLVVRVGAPAVAKGEPTTRRVTRPEGAITKVLQEGSLVVRVGLDVDATLSVAERTERTRLTETADETARWDGRVKSVRTPMGSRRVRGSPRTKERAPAVTEARQHATAAVVTRLSSTLAAEVLRQVDRQDPRPPPGPVPQPPQRRPLEPETP